MASERQIEANRRNSALSTGPSAGGLLRTRANATTHGLAGEAASVGSPEFAERRTKWAVEYRPEGDAACWALDRLVAASLRIERCEKHLDELRASGRRRARLAWEEDRALEAAETFARLARQPVVASRRLRTTAAGVDLLMEAWFGLLSAMIGEGRPWTEAEASRALDLLGVDPLCRAGRSPIDPLDDSDPETHRRQLVEAEVARLEALRDAMAEIDEADRDAAGAGESDLSSKPTRLALRYERDAWRRYDRAMAELRGAQVADAPGPIAAPPPIPSPGPGPEPGPSEGMPPVDVETYLAERGYADEDEFFEALRCRHERAVAFLESGGRLAPDRSQFATGRGHYAGEPVPLAP